MVTSFKRTVKHTVLISGVILGLAACNQPDGKIIHTQEVATEGNVYIVESQKLVSHSCGCENAGAPSSDVSLGAENAENMWRDGYSRWEANINSDLKMAHPSLRIGDVDLAAGAVTVAGAVNTADRLEGLIARANAIITATPAGETLSVASAIEIDPTASTIKPLDAAAAAELTNIASAAFEARNLDWVRLNTAAVDRGIISISGEAPDAAAQKNGFEVAKRTLQGLANGQSLLVVDGIATGDSGAVSVGETLIGLANSEKTVQSCQKALNATMDGRNVQFNTGQANISSLSAPLLDATTGIILLCDGFGIEVRGHTDARGNAASNQRLSEARAKSVRSYLLDRGGKADHVKAIGLGASQPLIDEATPEAWAANRRTEFVVLPQ